ncbi:MAG: alpha/beta fold hydrolase [Candidatus Omnitrophota bacterium]
MKRLISTVFAIVLCVVSTAVYAITQRMESDAVVTRDNVRIAYERYQNGSDSVVIICPGFYNSKKNRWMRKAVELVSPEYDVMIFDFRGHGQSGGTFTWSAKEDMDVDAVVDRAKDYGYKRIGILAFSLGAAASVNDAAHRTDIDSMVLISCPTRFNMIDFHFWKFAMFSDLKDNIECKWEGKGARYGSIFYPKKDPIDAIRAIHNTAILFIHGDNDWVINDRHSRKLYEAASGTKKLEVIKGGLHAERIVQFYPEKLKKIILEWFSETFVR